MTIMEFLRGEAWIAVLVIAIIIGIYTFLKIKGKVGFKIGFSLIRGGIFFAIFYLPLIKQPILLDNIALPIIGIILFLFGITFIILGSRELTKTELQGAKGVPKEIITTGLYKSIRHPINLGLIFTFAGWYIIWSGDYALIILIILIITLIIETFWEERNLQKIFGDNYKEYKKKVGMFFPKIKRTKSTE